MEKAEARGSTEKAVDEARYDKVEGRGVAAEADDNVVVSFVGLNDDVELVEY